MCLSNFGTTSSRLHMISWLWDFARSGGFIISTGKFQLTYDWPYWWIEVYMNAYLFRIDWKILAILLLFLKCIVLYIVCFVEYRNCKSCVSLSLGGMGEIYAGSLYYDNFRLCRNSLWPGSTLPPSHYRTSDHLWGLMTIQGNFTKKYYNNYLYWIENYCPTI